MGAAERIQEAIAAFGLAKASDRVLVMLSGGADSVCLLHVLQAELDSERIAALHVNYGLREDSDGDQQFCQQLCDQYGVELSVFKEQLPEEGNLQAQARTVRYRLAEKCAADQGLNLIATAHTASDQAETVIYRLAASPGRRALLGIAEREGKVIRPLLSVSAKETRAYCRQLGLNWCQDLSNTDISFARNRIRHRVLPELKKIHPAAERNILATRDQLLDEDVLLRELLEKTLADIVAAGSPIRLEASRAEELSVPLRRLVVRELLERVAGVSSLPISGQQVEEIIALARKGGSKQIDLGPVQVVSEYGILTFQPTQSEDSEMQAVELPIPGSCDFGRWHLVSELVTPDISDLRQEGSAVLDADLVGSSVLIRPWQHGDRMKPLGLDGSKLLQDIFTDRKVPLKLRRLLPVVEVDGEVAWVAGVAVSEKFKVTEMSSKAVRLSARKSPIHP